jgi:hypothetical protein
MPIRDRVGKEEKERRMRNRDPCLFFGSTKGASDANWRRRSLDLSGASKVL